MFSGTINAVSSARICFAKTKFYILLKKKETEHDFEFWSSICDFEIHCQHESPDSGDSSFPQFIKKALPHLVPMLLEKLGKSEEGKDAHIYGCKEIPLPR